MKKKILLGFIATILVFIMMFSFLFFVVLRGEIKVDPSPNGDYEVVSWLIDKGGGGYSLCQNRPRGIVIGDADISNEGRSQNRRKSTHQTDQKSG